MNIAGKIQERTKDQWEELREAAEEFLDRFGIDSVVEFLTHPSLLGVAASVLAYSRPEVATVIIITTAVNSLYETEEDRSAEQIRWEELQRGSVNLGTLAGVALRFGRMTDHFLPLLVVSVIIAIVVEMYQKENDVFEDGDEDVD